MKDKQRLFPRSVVFLVALWSMLIVIGTPERTPAQQSVQIPDTPVRDQYGRTLKFYSDLVKGKTIAINFFFTTCKTACLPAAAIFKGVQQELGRRVERDLTLISISLDPVTDVPERVSAYAAEFHAEPGWTLITGRPSEIHELLKALGAFTTDKANHTPMILVGNDSTGHWTRIYGLAPVSSIVQTMSMVAGTP